jgi:hypothetical protein
MELLPAALANAHGHGRRLGTYPPKQHAYRPQRQNTITRSTYHCHCTEQKPQRPHNRHHNHAISLPHPGPAASPPRLHRPDTRRLLPESTIPLERLVARLLVPCVVANLRKGASRRPAHAGATPFAAEMLEAGRRLASRDFRQQLRDASIRRSRRGGTWRRCGQTAIAKPLGR